MGVWFCMMNDLLFLFLVFLLMSSSAAVFIFFSTKHSFLKKLSKPLPNLIILAIYIIVANMDYDNLAFKHIAGLLIGPVIGSFIAGNLGILFYYQFNLKNFTSNYLNQLSTSLFIPLLFYLFPTFYWLINWILATTPPFPNHDSWGMI